MTPFPFDAVVGHDDAKLALRLAALDPLIGGVLLRGHKGSAKTTLARGLAALLDGAPFVELPLGATEDRVVGSLDIRAALSGGEVQFHPGLLARADGGVLYVDEINLLADHLVDVLLDVAVSGRNIVERDGVSHRHDAHFVLVGTMNPEEGELRPQLLDRFGLCVTVEATTDLTQRAEAVRRRLAFDGGQRLDIAPLEPTPPEPAATAKIGDDVIEAANRLAVAVGAEGLRADLTMCRAAAAHARLAGRTHTTIDDVARVAPLVLAHRSRRGPFDPPVLPPEAIQQALREALDERDDDDRTPETTQDESDDDRARSGAAGTQPLPIGGARRPQDWERSRPVPSARGRAVGDVPAVAGDSIAIIPTARRIAETGFASADALRTSVRVSQPRRTIVLCVDLSGSMGANERATTASGTVLGLLGSAYERRERVALVTFSGSGAQVVLTPTSSIEVARHRLDDLQTGGETPLAAGLSTALQVARRASTGDEDVLIAVLTDGRATGAPDAVDRAIDMAAAIRAAGVSAIVLDCESGSTRLGLAGRIAEAMGARYVPVDELRAETIIGGLHHQV
jgi:magnesium chelatase subunit D